MILITSSSKHLKITQNLLKFGRYPDGEIYVDIPVSVKGKEVAVVGSTEPPADNIIELLLTLDTLKKSGVRKINLFIPYMGFAKSDSVKKAGRSVGISAFGKIIKSLLGEGGNVFTVNSHSPKIPEYFGRSFTDVSALPLLAEEFKGQDVEVVSPDAGGVGRAIKFASLLGKKEIIKIGKKRISETEVEDISLEGDIKGKDVVIVDDMVQSGGTILAAVETLKKRGAGDIYLAVVHMVYSAGGYKKLEALRELKKIVTTNTIKPLSVLSKIKILDISKLVLQTLG